MADGPGLPTTRRLIDGTRAASLPAPREITIRTRCPGKWLLVDLQTGYVWADHEGRLRQAGPDQLAALRLVDGQALPPGG